MYGETERRGGLLINHGGEITDLGGGYLTLVQGSQQTTLHLSNTVTLPPLTQVRSKTTTNQTHSPPGRQELPMNLAHVQFSLVFRVK